MSYTPQGELPIHKVSLTHKVDCTYCTHKARATPPRWAAPLEGLKHPQGEPQPQGGPHPQGGPYPQGEPHPVSGLSRVPWNDLGSVTSPSRVVIGPSRDPLRFSITSETRHPRCPPQAEDDLKHDVASTSRRARRDIDGPGLATMPTPSRGGLSCERRGTSPTVDHRQQRWTLDAVEAPAPPCQSPRRYSTHDAHPKQRWTLVCPQRHQPHVDHL
jgi:hypothetical protein